MTTTMTIEPRNDLNVSVTNSAWLEGELICATTNRFVLLRTLSLPELRELAETFANDLDSALLKYFLQRSSEVRKGGGRRGHIRELMIANQDSPEALAIRVIAPEWSPGIRQVSGRHCKLSALSDALAVHGLLDGYRKGEPKYTAEWQIVYETPAIQRQVVETMLAGQIRNMGWVKPMSNLAPFASQRILELFDDCSTSIEVLERLCSPLAAWFQDPKRKGANGTDTEAVVRPWSLGWFATWLAERGALLFPLTVVGMGTDLYPLRYRHFVEEWLCLDETRVERAQFYDLVARTFPRVHDGARDRPRLLVQTLNLCAPGLATGRISAETLSTLKKKCDSFVRENIQVIMGIWRLEEIRLKAAGISPTELQALADLLNLKGSAALGRGSDLWEWVDNPEAFVPPHTAYARRHFHAGPNLLSHVADLRAVFPVIAGQSATTISGRVSVWLFFLSSLDDVQVPPRLIEVRPELIASLKRKEAQTTLLSFMVHLELSQTHRTNVLSTLMKSWKASAELHELEDRPCPVSSLLFHGTHRRGAKRPTSSTRRSIDMDILELLIEENRCNDFEFSRSRRHPEGKFLLDNRLVVDPDSGGLVSVWWPGVAVLMDVLLQIPMRHKQGRYLDSGEGDETWVDLETLDETKNTLQTATKGRSQSFIHRVSLSPMRNEPGLGMFINTNKTGRDYAFPWLQVDIAANVRRVTEWQMRFNPISEPVSDRPRNKYERAADADEVLVYPVFRDPERADNSPVSGTITLEYFRALLRHVEKKYNLANGTSVRFFDSSGNPIYDIHALRVTGVTRLLSMGVDVRIVRLLVGHASLAMTWYYEQISNQRVASVMEEKLELRRPTREALIAMNEHERERFLARLFNRCSEPTLSVGQLRGVIEERSPLLDMRIDGLCPGTRCADADVWRPRACSLCKFFMTGAPFLAGLELKLNDLMAELIFNQKIVANLRDRLYETRRNGDSIRSLTSEIVSREQVVDNILSEWEAQFQYVKKAEADLASWLNDVGVADPHAAGPSSLQLVSPTPERLSLSLRETHHLELFTRLVEGAKRVDGFVPILGTREARDAMLLEIARHDHKADLFFRLDPKLRRSALDQFALILIDQELAASEIERLIDGTTRLASVAGALDWLQHLSEPSTLLLTAEGTLQTH